jgi:alpha-D-ribose 1-methylphosphonate 5-triphosphate synthase subunit PhnH
MSDTQIEAAELSARFLDLHESQIVFRLLLDALSQPGTDFHLPAELVTRIPVVEIPLLALLGYDTPFALVGADTAREQLVARATSGRISDSSAAGYLGVCDSRTELLPMGFCLGTPMRPDTAAQVSVQVNGIFTSAKELAATLHVSGPGVESVNHVICDGATTGELEFLLRRDWTAPRGLDMWIIGVDGSFIGIPRTSRVSAGPSWSKGVS